MEKIPIFLVDDHRMVVDMWSTLLGNDPRFEIVGFALDGQSAMEKIQQTLPSVVLMDIALPGQSGMELTRQIRKELPSVKVVAVSMHNNVLMINQLLQNGAAGYVSKTSRFEEMSEAVVTVANGGVFISEDIKEMITSQMINPDKMSPSEKFKQLTRRESEIIGMLREGLSSKEVATRLTISTRTVEVHRYNIFRKMGVSNVVSLMKMMNEYHY